MPDADVRNAVDSLPWLAPSASALAAICRSAPSAWQSVRQDPAAVLLLARATATMDAPFPAAALDALAPLEFAGRLLGAKVRGVVDWSVSPGETIHRLCLTTAEVSRGLVVRLGRGDPEKAWTAGLLAPMGWLAAAAVVPDRVAKCLADSELRRHPTRAQQRHFGTDVLTLTRRLITAWSLPPWLASVIGRLDLPLAHAGQLGSDPVLFSAVRLALESARRAGLPPLTSGLSADLSSEMRLMGDMIEIPNAGQSTIPWTDPYRAPLLADLLAVALDRGRLRRASVVARLQRETEALHETLSEQARSEARRLRESKLSALAELAAGAGHEINNPLAVISGQAQYILRHEEWLSGDEQGAARQALGKIIDQTRRIHNILRDLMQFARPTAPRPVLVDLPTLLGEVVSSLEEMARQKLVRVELHAPARFTVHVDGEQLGQALTCLVRNAIEAAVGGWVRLTLHQRDGVVVWVEDSGPGPNVEQIPHLFDPFFCGRNAGRGKGLGLPVAWRLVRQQGGDVYLEPRHQGEPTRFVLALPQEAMLRDAA